MQYLIFIPLLALVAVSIALPADIEYVQNVTRAAGERAPVGFGSFGSGTFGGQGGQVLTVWDVFALRDALNSNQPRVVYVRGRIDLTPLFSASPGVRLNARRLTSIIGGDINAEIFGGGIVISGIDQIIIRNIKFNNALSYARGEQPDGNGGIVSMVPGEFSEIDAIDITNSEYIWVDHCEFSDDPWDALSLPRDQRRHDGLIDMKRGANWITISNNIFRNHNHNILIGHSDNNANQDRDKLKVTFVGNWFMGTIQRNPRVRFGEVHILNNLYTDITLYGIGIGAGASVVAERNMFINSERTWGYPAGVPNPPGNIVNQDNVLLGNSRFEYGIPNQVHWSPYNYYNYRALSVWEVENHVRRNAGVW